MFLLQGTPQHFLWGSTTAIPEYLGQSPTAEPVAEMWFGAHSRGPARLASHNLDLATHINSDPAATLGVGVMDRFGPDLPYLLKLIAPAAPLSLQVHPNLAQARDGYRRAQRGGRHAPLDYVDANHKPELLYALTDFEALCGFRAPRRAAELLSGLTNPVARHAARLLSGQPSAAGMKAALAHILTATTSDDVTHLVAECGARLEAGASPSVRSDRIVALLHEHHPGDRGVVASLLLNPVTLREGEAIFVPAGSVHAYLTGFGVEIMANSDNVLRAGLTAKNVDVPELLAIADPVAAPPIRVAEEHFDEHSRTYYAPVDDFELSIITPGPGPVPVRGRGPRILLALDGVLTLEVDPSHVESDRGFRLSSDGRKEQGNGSGQGVTTLSISRGEAVFVAAQETNLRVTGPGRLVQADVP